MVSPHLTMANLVWFVVIYLCNTQIFLPPVSAASDKLDLVTLDKDDNSCTTTLEGVTLDTVRGVSPFTGSKGTKGARGIEGEKGDPGLNGQEGDQGQKGKKGPIGNNGQDGKKGPKGLKGDKGEEGPRGPKGQDGSRGPTGVQGPKGSPGRVGTPKQGIKGSEGPVGPPGYPGVMGSCRCKFLSRSDGDNDVSSGSAFKKSEEQTKVCKEKNNTKESEEYYIGPGNIKVKCLERGGAIHTCIQPHADAGLNEVNDTGETNPFWLTSKDLTMEKLYGLTRIQLLWLQQKSDSVFQKIKYYCTNSVPYNSSDADHSLMMMSWNDVVFGPIPSKETPFHYTVSQTDGCYVTRDEKTFSIINIESDVAQRLPVVDFLIRDVRADRKIGIEHSELCFY